MHNRHTASLVATVFLFLSSQAPASPLQMFIFGDSLSDGGNMFALSGGLAPPSPPYAGVFSNGPVWVDQFADDRGLTTTNAYAAALGLDTPGGEITNFAVAGSYTGAQLVDFGTPIDIAPSANAIDPLAGAPVFPGLQGPPPVLNPLLSSQVEAFRGATFGVAPADAVYAVWAGANDFVFADQFFNPANPGVPLLATDLVTNAVGNVSMTITELAAMGAQEFLVFNVPDIGQTPFGFLTGRAGELTAASVQYNLELALELDNLRGQGLDIKLLDIFALFDELLANPVAAGFTDTDLGPAPPPLASCVDDFSNPPIRVDAFCGPLGLDPNDRIFWDSVHPTSAVHSIIADAVKYAVVSEPPVMLLLAVSLIAFGTARKRRAV